MPPLTGLEPSSVALSLNHRFSLPSAFFHEITVAPYSRISTLSPVGSEAAMRELSSLISTTGCGALDLAAEALGRGCGLCGRSTIVAAGGVYYLEVGAGGGGVK